MNRVCYVSDAPFLGGAERYLTLLIRGLDRNRYQPGVLMRTPEPGSALAAWRDELVAERVPVLDTAMRLPFRPLDALGIVRRLGELSPHLVHVNMPGPYDGQMGLVAPLARLSGAQAVVSTEHLPMVERLPRRALVKSVGYRFMDRVLTVSEANLPFLTGRQRVPQRRAIAIANALPADFAAGAKAPAETRASMDLPPDAVVVVFLGNLLPHKGLHRVIDALSTLAQDRWRLLVIGEGPERPRCEALARERNCLDRIRFAGRVSAGDVKHLLAAGDVLALPSTIEGMPYVVLEAMACGLAVVASNVFGIPEMVVDGETGLLVDAEDVAGLGAALARVINDDQLRVRMGGAGRTRFRDHFTLDRQVSAVMSLYDELLSGRR